MLTFSIGYSIRPASGGRWRSGEVRVCASTRGEALSRSASSIPASPGDVVRKWIAAVW